MSCEECEKAEATLLCVDEALRYCGFCSAKLHAKKARMYHHIEPIMAPLVCDECECAAAEVECLDCGGRKSALNFCLACSASLHSRAARSMHQLGPIRRGVKKHRRETVHEGKKFIDLTDSDDAEEKPRISNVVVDEKICTTKSRKDLSQTTLKSVKEEDGIRNGWVEAEIRNEKHNALKPTKIEEGFGNARARRYAKEGSPPRTVPHKRIDKAVGGSTGSEKGRNHIDFGKENIIPEVKAEGVSKIQSSNQIAGTKGAKKDESFNQLSPEKVQRRTQRTRTPRNCFNEEKGEWSSSSSSESCDDDEEYGVHRIRRGSLSFEAFVVEAEDLEEVEAASLPPGDSQEAKAASGIKDRIKKMLDLGLHPDTPDIEAQQALKNAQRLLTKHNLEQADVLKGNLVDTSSLIGGMRIVELRAKGRTKQGRMESWILELGWVIADNFDCQYFFKAGNLSKPLRVVFYGISHNAECAGYAFAATFNRITIMSAGYVSTKTFEQEGQDMKPTRNNQGSHTRVARTNYRRGIVAGLKESVQNGQRVRRENQRGHDREDPDLGNACAHGESDFVTDADDNLLSSPPNSDGEEDHPNRVAERVMAITALVMHSQKVGEEFIQGKGIKLRRRTQQSRSTAWNEEAFVQGKKDAESIDINQKAIRSGKSQMPRRKGRS